MATVLVAEDDARILKVCRMWLARDGHNVPEARNGVDAMELLQTREVDLLISDVDMPGMTGTDLVAWWRVQKKSRKPVIMFTAGSGRIDVASQMKDHDVRLFSKPFSPPKLMSVIRDLLSGDSESVLQQKQD